MNAHSGGVTGLVTGVGVDGGGVVVSSSKDGTIRVIKI